jgi:hypothetical protein
LKVVHVQMPAQRVQGVRAAHAESQRMRSPRERPFFYIVVGWVTQGLVAFLIARAIRVGPRLIGRVVSLRSGFCRPVAGLSSQLAGAADWFDLIALNA